MPSYALAAIGRDRPGIVAAVSRVLYETGCNVEDSSMTLLRGNFAIMLVLAAPEGLAADELTRALGPVADELELVCSILPVNEEETVPRPTHILTVYAADRGGILYRVTEMLARAGVSITDLDSRLVTEQTPPVYAAILELTVAPGDLSAVRDGLAGIHDEMGVDLTLREIEEDIL